jgi:uncharacterized protein (DUF342 family)
MRLFLVKDKPEEKEVLSELSDGENLNIWLKRLRALGVPQDSLKYDVLKKLHASSEKPFGEHLVAEGQPPVDEGIEITYYFEAMKSPASDDDAKADYYHLGYGVDVVEGQLLAKQEMQGPGKDGFNVIGTRLPYQVHSDKSALLYNPQVYIEKDGKVTQFFSKINGILLNKNLDSLDVYATFQIKGSVGFQTGNINSGTDVEVEGDVKTGFSVRSKKNIFIQGVVEKNVTLEADGDITIEGGISPNATIKAGGDIELKFAQGANLKASGHIRVSSYLYDCMVLAEKSFTCAGVGSESRGAVIGGVINALELIKVVAVGSQNALTTLIVGIHHGKYDEMQQLKREKKALNEDLKRLMRSLPLDLLNPNLKAELKKLPDAEKRLCQQKISQIISHRSEISALGAQIKELEPDALTQNFDASIQISKALFPDVKIVLCQQYNLIQDKYDAIVFSLNEEKKNK